jgi:hypothetical protein
MTDGWNNPVWRNNVICLLIPVGMVAAILLVRVFT